MAYTKTNWQTGDIVTSEKLNKIEQGIVDAGPMIVHATEATENDTTTYTLDKTFNELKTAFDAGTDVKILVPREANGATMLLSSRMTRYGYGESDGVSQCAAFFEESDAGNWGPLAPFMTDSVDGYPVCSQPK